jgi:hypothetical protein
VWSARFTPDGHSVVYSAAWEGSPPSCSRPASAIPSPGPLGFRDADLMAIAPSGEMAAMLRLKFVSSFEPQRHAGPHSAARRPPRANCCTTSMPRTGAPTDRSSPSCARRTACAGSSIRIGNVLYQTPGWVGAFRISPDGQRIAFPRPCDTHRRRGRRS